MKYSKKEVYYYRGFETRLIPKVASAHSEVYYLEYKDMCLCLTLCGLENLNKQSP